MLQILAQGRRLLLPPLPSCQCPRTRCACCMMGAPIWHCCPLRCACTACRDKAARWWLPLRGSSALACQSLVRTTCGVQAARFCHWSGRHRGAWVPDSGCLAQRAHRAESMLTTFRVLGSHPWLFEHLLATQEGTSNKANTGSVRMPTPHNKGKAVQRDGSSASPTQGLGCQRATCTSQVVCTRPRRGFDH